MSRSIRTELTSPASTLARKSLNAIVSSVLWTCAKCQARKVTKTRLIHSRTVRSVLVTSVCYSGSGGAPFAWRHFRNRIRSVSREVNVRQRERLVGIVGGTPWLMRALRVVRSLRPLGACIGAGVV